MIEQIKNYSTYPLSLKIQNINVVKLHNIFFQELKYDAWIARSVPKPKEYYENIYAKKGNSIFCSLFFNP